MAHESAIEILNSLITTCRDGETGYLMAAQGVKTPALVELFEEYSRQRALFASKLRSAVEELGGKAADGGSLGGRLQRGWLNVKSLVVGQDECQFIAECAHSEAIASQAYQEALQADLPADVHSVILRQFDRVKEGYARIQALEEVCAR